MAATVGEFVVVTVEGDLARTPDELLNLCAVVFPGFDPDYLTARLPHVASPAINLARGADGQLVGFKLGYQRGEQVFYSWLGGVHPDARGKGVARELMTSQHDWASSRGYRFVETRTRAVNSPMIILNLKCGFQIVGFETDSSCTSVVTQRKILARD